MRLLIATRNPHKLDEIRAILAMPGLALLTLNDVPAMPEVEEDRDTLQGNAEKKATTAAQASGLWALADDSGLEVDALDGAPGVYSARYAGDHVSYADNNRKLLSELSGHTNRSASFRCVVTLSDPAGSCASVVGCCRGRIVEAPRGGVGFGYDPLFQPDGSTLTFAEMDPEAKNRVSHRFQALTRAREAWHDLFGATPERMPGASTSPAAPSRNRARPA